MISDTARLRVITDLLYQYPCHWISLSLLKVRNFAHFFSTFKHPVYLLDMVYIIHTHLLDMVYIIHTHLLDMVYIIHTHLLDMVYIIHTHLLDMVYIIHTHLLDMVYIIHTHLLDMVYIIHTHQGFFQDLGQGGQNGNM